MEMIRPEFLYFAFLHLYLRHSTTTTTKRKQQQNKNNNCYNSNSHDTKPLLQILCIMLDRGFIFMNKYQHAILQQPYVA